MQIGIPKESLKGEVRVAATPKTVKDLKKLGFEVVVEKNAGLGAQFSDSDYENAGAKVVNSEAIYQSEIIYKVNAPTGDELLKVKDGTTIVSHIFPRQNQELVDKLARKNISVLAMDMVPRISRAQSMDALSSMANISGYRAVVEAAHEFGRFFTGQITAAGKMPPATVLVMGAGVAGLAAIGAAKSLGAIVKAFDVRKEVAEQIESMGGEFLSVDYEEKDDGSVNTGYAKEMSEGYKQAQAQMIAENIKNADIVITTAAIPGKPAPKLVSAEHIASMKRGSVIVDLAAATGGNSELTKTGEKFITDNGVIILGYTDLPNRLAGQSSQLYSTNLVNLTKLLCPNKDGNININFDDVVLRNMTIVKDGELTFPPPEISVSAAPQAKKEEKEVKEEEKKAQPKIFKQVFLGCLALIGVLAIGSTPPAFLAHMMVFILSIVIGYYVVWNVTHALHTPLMSVTNAISGIIVVGAIVQIGQGSAFASFLSFLAILLVSINIFGGFAVTRRMLLMFRKDKD